MENASKALIMAGTMLLGIMLISLTVYLFSSFARSSSSMYAIMEEPEITRFNSQFLKYYGTTINEDGTTSPIPCTAHDIISLANLAKQYNEQNETQNILHYGQNIMSLDGRYSYIQISLEGNSTNNNVEKWDEATTLSFLKNSIVTTGTGAGIQHYGCTQYEIDDVTKLVCYMRFEILP